MMFFCSGVWPVVEERRQIGKHACGARRLVLPKNRNDCLKDHGFQGALQASGLILSLLDWEINPLEEVALMLLGKLVTLLLPFYILMLLAYETGFSPYPQSHQTPPLSKKETTSFSLAI